MKTASILFSIVLSTGVLHAGPDRATFYYSCGRAIVEKDGMYGYIDTKGNLITPRKYDSAKPYAYDKAVAAIKDEVFLLSKAGRVVSKYSGAVRTRGVTWYKLSNDIVYINRKNECSCYNLRSGAVFTYKKDEFAFSGLRSNGYWSLRDRPSGFCKLFDRDGELIHTEKHFILGMVTDRVILAATNAELTDYRWLVDGVERGNKSGVLDMYYLGDNELHYRDSRGHATLMNLSGHVILSKNERYSRIGSMREGLRMARTRFKTLYFDNKNQVALEVPNDFLAFDDFSEGKIVVLRGGRSYFMDMKGKLSEQSYTYANSFSEGFAYVETEGKVGYVNHAFDFIYSRPKVSVPEGKTMSPVSPTKSPEEGKQDHPLEAGSVGKESPSSLPGELLWLKL